MKQFVVAGLGRFGSSVARTLYNLGFETLAIDVDETKVQELANDVTHAVQADATDEQAMRALGIRNFDVVVISIGQDIQGSILATLNMKELGVRYIVVKAISDLHGKVLSKVGADKVVYPEREMGVRVANNLALANFLDYIELAPGYSIVEVAAPEEFDHKTLKDLDFRARHGINIMAIKRGDDIVVSPGAQDIILKGDILVAMGDTEALSRLERKAGER